MSSYHPDDGSDTKIMSTPSISHGHVSHRDLTLQKRAKIKDLESQIREKLPAYATLQQHFNQHPMVSPFREAMSRADENLEWVKTVRTQEQSLRPDSEFEASIESRDKCTVTADSSAGWSRQVDVMPSQTALRNPVYRGPPLESSWLEPETEHSRRNWRDNPNHWMWVKNGRLADLSIKRLQSALENPGEAIKALEIDCAALSDLQKAFDGVCENVDSKPSAMSQAFTFGWEGGNGVVAKRQLLVWKRGRDSIAGDWVRVDREHFSTE